MYRAVTGAVYHDNGKPVMAPIVRYPRARSEGRHICEACSHSHHLNCDGCDCLRCKRYLDIPNDIVRIVAAAIILFVLVPAAMAQCGQQYGNGSDKPTNVTMDGVCLAANTNVTIPTWYQGIPGQMQMCFSTVNPGDTLAQLDYNTNQSYSGPTTQRQVYDPTLVTAHCIVIDKLMPGRGYMLIPATCNGTCTGGSFGLRGNRFKSAWSDAGYDTVNQKFGFVFTTPATVATHTLAWQFYPIDPPGINIFQGSPINIGIAGIWQDGPLPAYIYNTSLQIDGQNCTVSKLGTPCGTTGLSPIIDNNGSELVNNGANGYNVSVAQSGAYAGHFTLGGSPALINAYVFNQPGPMMRLTTSQATSIGAHTVTATFQATDAAQNAMGAPVQFSYTFNVVAPATFTRTAPTTFPAIPSLGQWNSLITSYGHQFYDGFKNENLAGKYDNDNYSAVGSNATNAVWNYGGDRIALEFGDYISSATGYWDANAQRVYTQRQAWMLNAPRSSNGIWQEWNLFPHAAAQYWWRFGDALSKKALQYQLTPIVANSGMVTEPLVWSYKYVPLDTIRTMPYSLGTLVDQSLIAGSWVNNSGVNEAKARLDILLQATEDMLHCNPVQSASNPYPVCPGTPGFDLGLKDEELIHYYTAQSEMGQTPDPRIPVELGYEADWFASTQYNQTGSDQSAAYTLWLIPGLPNGGVPLNMLNAPVLYTWQWAMRGDSCTLPTSGLSCLAVGDQMAAKTVASGYFYNAKAFNQAYKLWRLYYQWRTGAWTGLQTDLLPSTNPPQTPIADVLEPFNGASWPPSYPTLTATSNCVTAAWYTFEPTTKYTVKAALKSGSSCGAYTSADGAGGSLQSGTDNQYLSSAQVCGLQPSTIYCVAVGATDTAGNVSQSSWNPNTNQVYSVTTLAGSTVPSVTFSHSVTFSSSQKIQ